ncbi:hypothetical protein DEO72_LG7g1159 [Vigna unguiculata]|uniref:Uncharacterized protein n=1 Tax=Vigna unguiculata TaxID=3917 RepID=A0A4D6MEK4_VIGUN|nr:hypothetical protein DEO72_LG7g1159 [Vigna unguiculata]
MKQTLCFACFGCAWSTRFWMISQGSDAGVFLELWLRMEGCTFTQKTRESRVKGVAILPLGLWRVGQGMLLGRLGKVMFLLGFGEQVSGGLLPGFDEQTRVVVVSLRVRVVLLLGFGKGCGSCRVSLSRQELLFVNLKEAMLLSGFGDQVSGVLLLGFDEQARDVFCESQGRQRSYRRGGLIGLSQMICDDCKCNFDDTHGDRLDASEKTWPMFLQVQSLCDGGCETREEEDVAVHWYSSGDGVSDEGATTAAF